MEMRGLEARLLGSEAWGVVARHLVAPWLAAFGGLPEEADVLEIGCGGGFNAEAFLERYPHWRLTATDVDPAMVERASRRLKRFGSRVHVARADATALDVSDETFDVVVALGVWHHVGDWERATAEAGRVLRPGGRLLLADLLEGFFRGPTGRLFPPERTYRLENLPAALSRAGFARWRVRTAGSLWYRAVAEKGALAGTPARLPAVELPDGTADARAQEE